MTITQIFITVLGLASVCLFGAIYIWLGRKLEDVADLKLQSNRFHEELRTLASEARRIKEKLK